MSKRQLRLAPSSDIFLPVFNPGRSLLINMWYAVGGPLHTGSPRFGLFGSGGTDDSEVSVEGFMPSLVLERPPGRWPGTDLPGNPLRAAGAR